MPTLLCTVGDVYLCGYINHSRSLKVNVTYLSSPGIDTG